MTTTSIGLSIELLYTPGYKNVFVGFDNVNVVCTVSTISSVNMTVSLVEIQTGTTLKSQVGIYTRVQLNQRIELEVGTTSHKCVVQTDTGVVREDTVSVQVGGGLMIIHTFVYLFPCFNNAQLSIPHKS